MLRLSARRLGVSTTVPFDRELNVVMRSRTRKSAALGLLLTSAHRHASNGTLIAGLAAAAPLPGAPLSPSREPGHANLRVRQARLDYLAA